MGEMHTMSQPGNLRGTEHLNGLGKIKLKLLFFGKYIVRVWSDAIRDNSHQKGTVKYSYFRCPAPTLDVLLLL
jgi:hypothetical protein